MAAKKLHHSLGDYVTMGLSPVLIIALITSLMFFLTEVISGGQPHVERLRWTLFWFIFGIVWVARISMHPAVYERARLYGIILSLAVWVGLQRFLVMDQLEGLQSGVFRPFDWAILLAFFALIWWSAYRLTWDCTFIDDNIEATGKGVLEAAGLDDPRNPGVRPSPSASEGPLGSAPRWRSGSDGAEGAAGWLERWRLYREEQRQKPHTPGVWVVYFSLAALPLFGLGQALLPVEDVDRRRYAFWTLGVYTASGLGLLLTTCYLGLRRYLRQRKLKMPVAMTSLWLTLGGGLIAAMLVAAALLPRPQMEYSPFRRTAAKPDDLGASQHAMLSDSPGKGEGKPGAATPSNDPKAAANPNVKTKEQGGGKGKGKGGGKDGDKGNAADKSGSGNDSGKAKANSDPKNAQKGSEKDSQQSSSGESNTRPTSDQQGSLLNENQSRPPSSNPLEEVASKLGGLATFLKWVVFAILAILVIVMLLRSGLQFLANFTDWARRLLDSWRAWWDSLFGGRESADEASAPAPAEGPPPRRPFGAFANPFRGGVEQQSPEELVRYTFAALDAWADERDWGRAPDETPFEFAERLSEEAPALEEDVRRFVQLYAVAVYARGALTPACLPILRELWRRLEAGERRPVEIA